MSTGHPALPARFGRYELVDHIATGGMAEVFLARSFGVQGFQKHVVVKRLRPGLAQTPRMVQLFVQEARISAGLVHPNIAQIHELGAAAHGGVDSHYIAMEYIHGQDLTRVRRALHDRGETLPVELALFCAVRVLRALAYAHGRTDAHGRALGLVHRDVSPHNVLVSFQGEVKLVDFGIARLEGDVSGCQLPGGGKYAYMSPEQAAGAPLDGRSDVFSAGILLWELLVGHRLFQHPDPDEKLRRVMAAEVPDPGLERPELPGAIWPVLRRLLARERSERPRAADAADQLQALSFDLGLRGEGAHLGALLQELFPDLARRDPGGLDLDGLVADLARLASPGSGAGGLSTPSDELTGSLTGSATTASGAASADRAAALTSLPALRRLAPGERKTVVVVAAEVTGLAELSLAEEPEAVGRAHYRMLRRVRRIVDRHGGWLDRFQDDALVIFFGVPRTTEHDLDRALACAAQLVREVRGLRRRGLPLHLSLGVHQGEISVGRMDARAGRRLRYLARGDTTTLASRLCRTAGLDQVLVSERVAGQARGRFRFTSGPPVPQRGGTHDDSFRLVGRDTRVRASAGRWLPRGDELDRLGRALRRVAGGDRVVVAICGPAGVGKSRLLQELRDLARSRGLPVYAARAVPYTVDRPLATLRDLMARVMGVPGDGLAASIEVGLARLRELGLDAADVAVIASLFGLERAPAGGRGALLGAAGRAVTCIAERGPVLLAIEDAHHLSGLEREIVHHVIAATTGVPLLLLLTARGELPVGLGPVDENIALGALEPRVQHDLIAHLLGVRALAPELFALVQRRAEGNPRYVAAVVDALRSAGGIEVHHGMGRLRTGGALPPLPEGLEGLIAARIDALQGIERQALQVAAVIGRSFSTELLAEAVGADELAPALARLRAAGLLACEAGRCRFTSDLVFEAAAHGMLAARRAELHVLVADALLRNAPRDPTGMFELAEHLAAAGRPLDAARQADHSGELLRRRQLLPRAVWTWRRAVRWLSDAQAAGAPLAACLSGEAVLQGKLGEALLLLGEPEAAERHLQAGLDAASECEDLELEARATLALGRLLRTRGDPARARAHLELARELAAGATRLSGWRREVVVAALDGLGQLAHDAGDADSAAACFARALELAGDDDALAASALLGLAADHIRAGAESKALGYLEDARRRAGAAGDRILLGRIINNIGLVHHGAGRLKEALACFEEARELRRDTGYQHGEAVNLHNLGDTWLRLGEPGRAWASFERSRDLAASIGWAQGVALNELWMAWLEAGRSGGPLDAVAAAGERARELGDLDTAVTARWLVGRLQHERGQLGAAADVLADALEQARQLGAGVLSRDISAELERVRGATAGQL